MTNEGSPPLDYHLARLVDLTQFFELPEFDNNHGLICGLQKYSRSNFNCASIFDEWYSKSEILFQ